MPFSHKEYDRMCSKRSKIELRKELKELDDGIAAAGVTTGVLVLAIPVTMGLSAVGIGATGPAIYELRKRRAIVRKYLNASGPEVGPNFSTQSAPLPHIHSKQAVPKPVPSTSSSSRPTELAPKTSMDHLPEYTPTDGTADDRQKQVYVPIEEVDPPELPPSYDEATLQRVSTGTSSIVAPLDGSSSSKGLLGRQANV